MNMPQARQQAEPVPPAPLSPTEAAFIKQTICKFYGLDAVARNYGPDPKRLCLHVETAMNPGLERHECLGLLMCEVVRDAISLEVTKRGSRVRGGAKIAYRQGDVI